VVRRTPPAKRTKKPKEPEFPPLFRPPAPALPTDWQDRSVPRYRELVTHSPSATGAPKAGGDDWFLVRLADKKVGWVLARNVFMLVPDEIAQYAEGQRITAYTALGEVKDGGQMKPNWLWTTSTGGLRPYDFDSYRVFVWSTRRHRYETAFIQRNVEGFYPVEAVDLPNNDEKGFALVLRDKDGKLNRVTHGFSGYRVRVIGKEPYQRPAELPSVSDTRSFDTAPEPETPARGMVDTVRGWWNKGKSE
jgi:hypothetical protein